MMRNHIGTLKSELLVLIVNDDTGSDALRIARKNGVTGGTIFYGRGTIRQPTLRFLGMDNIRKEIVLMAMGETDAERMMNLYTKQFHLEKPNRGIVFRLSLKSVFGTHKQTHHPDFLNREDGRQMYEAIITIVERGKAEEVIAAAESAGSQGGTIINARGAGLHETSKIFGIEIEPEKEIVLILADISSSDAIIESINQKIEIEKPGHGILFTMGINEARGLY